MNQVINSWHIGNPAARRVDVPAQPDKAVVILKALTTVNVGKGHYLPGDEFTVLPGRAQELIDAGLAKKVGGEEVPKEARADDGAYAEEPATPLAVSLAQTKVATGQSLEEVSAVSEKDAKAAVENIDEAEAEKSVKEDKTPAQERKTKEDKGAAAEQTK